MPNSGACTYEKPPILGHRAVRATYKDGKILNNSRTMLKCIPACEFNFVHNYQINIISLYAEHFQIYDES